MSSTPFCWHWGSQEYVCADDIAPIAVVAIDALPSKTVTFPREPVGRAAIIVGPTTVRCLVIIYLTVAFGQPLVGDRWLSLTLDVRQSCTRIYQW